MNIPIDALPDLTNVQVLVVTEAGALAPLEVERFVTNPVESTMNGLPDVEEIRSVSRLGLSAVTIVFHEGVDIYRARQLVSERLSEAREKLQGSGEPQIGPLSTATRRSAPVRGPGRGHDTDGTPHASRLGYCADASRSARGYRGQ